MEKGIFISYSHKDSETVAQIVKAIEKTTGEEVWFDHKLRGGEEYFSVIAESILKCEYFVFVVSPNSVISNWCIHELEFAMSEQRKIIAVWLEDFTPPARVRLVISNTHYIRSYALQEDSLAKTIAQSFQAEQLELGGESEHILSEQQQESGKYFISPDEKARIRQLLELEKNEDYIACFAPDAAVLLGLAYELAVYVPKDDLRAQFYYHIAAYKGNLDGEYLSLAMKLAAGEGERSEIIKRMFELVEAGSVKAMVYWGDEVYLGNWGMAADKATAYQWFLKAAAMGDPAAKYFVGFGYRVGDIGQTDYALAWMYLLEAEQQYFPRATRQMGIMYQRGISVEKDLETARKYFHKAMERGDGMAVNYLGNLEYNEGNYELAVEHYASAVEYAKKMNLPNGVPFYNLGWCYEYGQGVEKDPVTAIDLYMTASQHKHKSSKKRVSRLIYYSIEDLEQKRELLRRTASMDCAYAEYYLASTYDTNAEGKRKQCAEALAIYEQGADKGCLYSIEMCINYYSWMIGGKEFTDREKALQNFQLYFSLIDLEDNKKFKESCSESAKLELLYYIYAVELGIDTVAKKPDKPHSLYYFRKCLERPQGMKYWNKIVLIADNYSRVYFRTSNFYQDIPHSNDLADLCFEFLDRAIREGVNEETNAAAVTEKLRACYERLLKECQNQNKIKGQMGESLAQLKEKIERIKAVVNDYDNGAVSE